MSGQGTPARMLKSSPGPSKQGPMKATIPISSVLKHTSNLRNVTSPNVSPTTHGKTRISPEHASGQRSPGSSSFKAKSKINGNESMRRTASLDMLYLKGHWPRDLFYWHTGILQINKATQTEESDWLDVRKIHCISENDEKTERMVVRSKMRTTKDSNSRHGSPGENTLNTSSQTLASCILSPTLKANPVNILRPLPKSSIRSSVEGLNQEIERIVLKTNDYQRGENSDFRQATPEGHRAPLAELFRTNRSRSVNTQTPQEFSSCASSGAASRESLSPLLHRRRSTGSPRSEAGDSQTSSPDNETSKFGTSPQINRFLAREPPDGCEKVRLKALEAPEAGGVAPQPSAFLLKPSSGSAFHVPRPDAGE